MRKNIWFISKYASIPNYGVGARLYYLANEIAKKDNYKVTLIGSDSNHLAVYPSTRKRYNIEKINNFDYLWIKTLKYGRSSSPIRMLSWIDFDRKLKKVHNKIDEIPDYVVISSLALTSIRYGMYLKKRFGCKLIFDIRDIYPLTLTEELGFKKSNLLVKYFSKLERRGYLNADLITGTMPNLVSHVKNVTGQNLDVFHSPLGIPEIWNNEVEFDNLNKTKIVFPTNKFIVGYSGSMGKSNALDCFVDTIKKMSKIDPEVHFVLVGDGDMKSKFIDELKNYSNVSIEDKIQQKNIPSFLSKCDLLYLSTHDSKVWEYGQSMNKIIDYMMAAKPVIASYSGFPTMINDANSGYFIKDRNSNIIIDKILYFKKLSKEDRDNYGLRGKKWIISNNNYKTIGENFIKEIEKIEKGDKNVKGKTRK